MSAGGAARIEALRRATVQRPADPEAWAALGNFLRALGRFDEAIETLARVVTLRPDDVGACLDLAAAMLAAGRRDEALVVYRDALVRDPQRAAAWNDFGAALRDAGRPAEALEAVERSLALDPGRAGTHYNRGVALGDLGRLVAARDAFARAIALDATRADPHYARGNVLRDLGDMGGAVAEFRAAVGLDPGHGNAWSNLLFTLNFAPGETDATLVAANRAWAATLAVRDLPPLPNPRDPQRRLRIGYVSTEFRRHHFLTEFLPVLRAHDRTGFHIACYADVAAPDRDTEAVAGMADSFRNLHGLDADAQAAALRADGVDILVALTGYLANDRALYARRIAPVQVTYINHLTATGLGTIDGRIGDVWLDPPGAAVAADPETPIRLDSGYGIYAPPDDAPEPGEPPGLATGYPTFGSFNALLKVTDETIALWARLLGRVPSARLLLKARELSQPEIRAVFQARLVAGGIDPARCELVGHVAERRSNMLHYARADIGLDPLPFAGGATTREMLWMGLPVITLAGATRASRIGASLLQRAGLGELVATTQDGYLRIAAGLAADLSRVQSLRAGLRDRLRGSALLDAVTHTRELEAAYRALWQRWCASATGS